MKILGLIISSSIVLMGNQYPKNYAIATSVFYESKSPINVEIATKINRLNCYQNNKEYKCSMYVNGKFRIEIDKESIIKFKKNEKENGKIKCLYNQEKGTYQKCKLVSIKEWLDI